MPRGFPTLSSSLLRHLVCPAAAPSVALVPVTEDLPAQHAALPIRGTTPGERRGTSVASPTAARWREVLAGPLTNSFIPLSISGRTQARASGQRSLG